ncbi:hypothetical protein BKA70DRAFT_1271259 [Coprinopsis sp. MPI-PUGE-AT-0042]|nr:hypothetical protein BKA70DRAFT_1271259 [Coprinopsis sp. MPI-PUGE-AT-0042]
MPVAHRSSSSLTLSHQHALHTINNASDARAPTILATASNARIYHTQLDAQVDEWTYSRQKGTLNFGRSWTSEAATRSTIPSDSSSDSPYWFTLADEATGKTVWMFQIPASGFQYEVDKPFFHVFNGRTRRFGLVFGDDDEASFFSKKVMAEVCKDAKVTSSPKPRGRSFQEKHHLRSRSLSARRLPVSRAQISLPAPNSFRHISHIGVNRSGLYESSSVSKAEDTSFKDILLELQQANTTSNQKGAVVDFWNDSGSDSTSNEGPVGSFPPAPIAY